MHVATGGIFISKPQSSSCGKGISLVTKASQIPSKPSVVQRYVAVAQCRRSRDRHHRAAVRYVPDPYLINGKKFDLRLYVVVRDFDPLKIYVFHDGLVRFATKKYVTSTFTSTVPSRFVRSVRRGEPGALVACGIGVLCPVEVDEAPAV